MTKELICQKEYNANRYIFTVNVYRDISEEELIFNSIKLNCDSKLLHQVIIRDDAPDVDYTNKEFLISLAEPAMDVHLFMEETIIYETDDGFKVYDPQTSMIASEQEYWVVELWYKDKKKDITKDAWHALLKARLDEVQDVFVTTATRENDTSEESTESAEVVFISHEEAMKKYFDKLKPVRKVEILGEKTNYEAEFWHRIYSGFQFPEQYLETKEQVISGLKNLKWLNNDAYAVYVWNQDRLFLGDEGKKEEVLNSLQEEVIPYWRDKSCLFKVYLISPE